MCQTSYPLDYTTCPKDQTPLQLATDLMPGLVLRGKYEVLEKLGQGGMGAVYKARHLAFDELRAIKFVSSHLLADESALARFRAEAVVARRLQHPNAVKVDDLDTSDDGRPFIVMEYVQGRSLRELFADDGAVSTKRVLSLARQACAALSAAHALGIVHRDIKPDNLMIVTGTDGKEILKVADFGLAKVREGFERGAEKALTQTGMIVGTPPYMSPEQASGLEVDGRSDLYSLGVVLYELFTGRLPFRSDSPLGMLIHHRETPPQPPAALGVPRPLADFLLKALAKRREDRFQTSEQMDESLRLLSLMPLPEFIGEGIQEGFDPQWTGSRHASRITTIQAPVLPKTMAHKRPEPPGSTVGGKKPPLLTTRPRPQGPSAEGEGLTHSPSRFWFGLAAAGVIAVWFGLNRWGGDPVPGTSQSGVPTTAASFEVRPKVSAPSEEPRGAERTDTMIRFDIDRLLGNSTALRDARVRVEVASGVVTLMGEAPSETVAQLATNLAASVPGVRQVFSTVRVSAAAQAQTTTANPPAPSTPSVEPPAVSATEPPRAPTPRPEEVIGEQVRVLLDRAREKMEARNPEAAEADFIAVLKLDPNNPVAKDALDRLRNRPKGPSGPPPGPRPTPF